MSEADDLPGWAKILRGFMFGQASDSKLLSEGGRIAPHASAYVSLDIGATGYDHAADVQGRVAKLLSLQEEAVGNPAWAPRDGKTYCNRAANFLAQCCGYFTFRFDAMANEMISTMDSDPRWRTDSLQRAHMAAMRGGLAFVTLREETHGHLAAVAPLPMEQSDGWGGPVPMLANVGAKNGFLRASEVFRVADRQRVQAYVLSESVA